MKSKNHCLDYLYSHSSVRNFDSKVEVPQKDEDAIIKAAQMAPTSCNMQAYSFIVVKDKLIKEQICSMPGSMKNLSDAGLIIIVCVDQFRLDYVAEESNFEYNQFNFLDSFIMGVADASIAAQNAAIAAELLNYGVCYLGALRQNMGEVIDLLKLPSKVFPLVGMAIGAASKKNPVKPRLPIDGVRFRDYYDVEAAKKAVQEYDKTMAETGIYEGRRFPLHGRKVKAGVKKEEEQYYGWIEHIGRRIASSYEEDTRSYLRKFLESIGFRFQ